MNSNARVTTMRTQSNFRDVLSGLQIVSLDELLKRAQLLSRVDTKYVASTKTLSKILSSVGCDYEVLEIEGKQSFQYRSCYYDDNNACYFDHHSGKRKRFKVRIRHYVDSDEKWFELKIKGSKGETIKTRLRCDSFLYEQIDGGLMSHLHTQFSKCYNKPFSYHLVPSMIVSYKRSTLLCSSKQERVTIDTDLEYYDPWNSSVEVKMNSTMAIVEIKSDGKKGCLEKVLFSAGCKQEEKLSKYCMGLASLKPSIRRNNFLPILKKLQKQDFVTRSW